MVEQGQTTESRQKMVCSGCWLARRWTRLISVPMAKTEPAGAAAMALTMKSVEPEASAASTTSMGHSGWTMTLDAGVTLAGHGDLVDGEAFVDGAEAVPEEDAGVAERFGGVAADGLVGIPDGHLGEGDAHGLGGVAAEVLVGEEEDALAAFEGPLEDLGGVGGGADDAAMLAAEAFEGGGGVHVGDGDDLLAAVGREVGAEDVVELFPAVGDGVEVGHVGHGAAGGEVGEDDGLVGAGEHVGGLGHEVDAAEDDGFGVGRVRAALASWKESPTKSAYWMISSRW